MAASVNKFWTPTNFNPEQVPEFASDAYITTSPYVLEFLPSPHPYRKGAVCPFVPAALKKDSIYFTYFDLDSDKKGERTIRACVDFLNSKSKELNEFSALIILFPKDFEIIELLKIHLNNKEICVRSHLMLGALHAHSMAASLHNEHYFPLRTPTPILVIRAMAPGDLVFLDPHYYSIKKRLVFLHAFIEKYSRSPSKTHQEQARNAIEIAKLHSIKLKNKYRLLTAIIISTIATLSAWIYLL